jgi:hypothetical protein
MAWMLPGDLSATEGSTLYSEWPSAYFVPRPESKFSFPYWREVLTEVVMPIDKE